MESAFEKSAYFGRNPGGEQERENSAHAPPGYWKEENHANGNHVKEPQHEKPHKAIMHPQ